MENTGVFRLDPSVASSKNVHPLIGKTPLMAFERYPAQGLVRFVYAMWSRDRSPLISTGNGDRGSEWRSKGNKPRGGTKQNGKKTIHDAHLDEGGALRPPPGLLLRPLLLGALAALLEFLHGGGHHLRRAVHAAVGALLRILVHLADERVGIGPELQGILAGAVGVLFLAGDALLAILRSLSI